jgi:hypothetical protein
MEREIDVAIRTLREVLKLEGYADAVASYVRLTDRKLKFLLGELRAGQPSDGILDNYREEFGDERESK